LERRSKQRNQQRLKNAHIDDLLSPAPALTPTNDFQEVKVSFKYRIIVQKQIIHLLSFTEQNQEGKVEEKHESS
jgi:hypothetical protein